MLNGQNFILAFKINLFIHFEHSDQWALCSLVIQLCRLSAFVSLVGSVGVWYDILSSDQCLSFPASSLFSVLMLIIIYILLPVSHDLMSF